VKDFGAHRQNPKPKTGQKSPEKFNLKTALRGPKDGVNLKMMLPITTASRKWTARFVLMFSLINWLNLGGSIRRSSGSILEA
jgi:hypothetical protein